MSGGHFDYEQYKIEHIADSIEEYLYGSELYGKYEEDTYINDLWFDSEEEKKKTAEFVRRNHRTLPNAYGLKEVTLAEFRKAVEYLRRAYVYAHRIDWLLSGDDGEETFHERLRQDLEALKRENADKVPLVYVLDRDNIKTTYRVAVEKERQCWDLRPGNAKDERTRQLRISYARGQRKLLEFLFPDLPETAKQPEE